MTSPPGFHVTNSSIKQVKQKPLTVKTIIVTLRAGGKYNRVGGCGWRKVFEHFREILEKRSSAQHQSDQLDFHSESSYNNTSQQASATYTACLVLPVSLLNLPFNFRNLVKPKSTPQTTLVKSYCKEASQEIKSEVKGIKRLKNLI